VIVKENIYTLVLWYQSAIKCRDYLKKSNDSYWKVFDEFVKSYEERLRNINEDIDVLAYFGEQNAID
jgi:hypothetical protein